MKKFSVLAALLLVFCLTSFLACNEVTSFFGRNNQAAADVVDRDTSYAFGMYMALLLSGQMGLEGLHYDYDSFRDGFRDVNEARETRFSEDSMFNKLDEFFVRLQAEMEEQSWIEGEKNREEGDAYMAQNRQRNNVITTPSGLQYEVITEGSGEKPGPTDYVQVHYEGSLINGTVFDSSYARGFPTEFPLNGVIPGWTEGLQLMSVGSTYRLFLPPELAYGSYGAGTIPPNSTLIFRVELLSILDESSYDWWD